MMFRLRIAGVALLAVVASQAWALQLGRIQVKSALNQPLVAAIPLHPASLAELEGLTVSLASAADFERAGLEVTPTDRTLRFRVVTDNNGQKSILVTSTQPVAEPYLDFLIQVDTSNGRQVREFVVLLDPVTAAPAPVVQAATAAPAAAPVSVPAPAEVRAPAATQSAPVPATAKAVASQPAPPPVPPERPTQAPAPATVPQPAPRAPAAQPSTAHASGSISVQRGDTLYGIAQQVRAGTGASANQMMLALKAANPEAFFRSNINNLKAGAILRIPTPDEVGEIGIAAANAEVGRQYEEWRSGKAHRATVVEGSAAGTAKQPTPGQAAPTSDHLALVPPSGEGAAAASRPGVAGGNAGETTTSLRQQLQSARGSLASLQQSNTELESRVHDLESIAEKSSKLLSLKDTTIAQLQAKLAATQSGNQAGAVADADRQDVSAAAVPGTPKASVTPWFQRPLTWIVVALVVLAALLAGLLVRRRRKSEPAVVGPLSDPEDLASESPGDEGYVDEGPLDSDEVASEGGAEADAAALEAWLAEDPENLDTHLALCQLHYEQGDLEHFIAAAEVMHAHVRDPAARQWREVAAMGSELAPGSALFSVSGEAPGTEAWNEVEEEAEAEAEAEPEDIEPLDSPLPDIEAAADAGAHDVDVAQDAVPADEPSAAIEEPVDAAPETVYAGDADPGFSDDPVDTKLDLARAYLDMGDPTGARAMLGEVLEEGSQMQQDEARRLLAETPD